MKTKKCSKCKKIKFLTKFHKNKNSKDGYNSWCKKCRKITRKKPIKLRTCKKCGNRFKPNSNIQKYCSRKCYKITKKEYYKKPIKPRTCKICNEEFKPTSNNQIYCSNCEEIAYKSYYKSKPLKTRICKICGKEFKTKSKANNQKYCLKCNKKAKKEYNKNYIRQKRKTDINYRITENLRHRIYMAVKNNLKSKHTAELIGCTIDELKKYIAKLFKPGMTWQNYGTYWHIDHIIPCASFNLSKDEEQRKCFHYTNLQPLWVEENLRKNKFYKVKEMLRKNEK